MVYCFDSSSVFSALEAGDSEFSSSTGASTPGTASAGVASVGAASISDCGSGDGVGVARSEERRRERKERALFFFSRRRRFASNTHRARARFDRCERAQAPLLPNENSFSSSVCSPKDGRFFIPFLLVDQNREKKVVDEDFFSLFTALLTLSFSLTLS